MRRRGDFPAQAVGQGQFVGDPPFILRVESKVTGIQSAALRVGHRAAIYRTEYETGDPGSRLVGNRRAGKARLCLVKVVDTRGTGELSIYEGCGKVIGAKSNQVFSLRPIEVDGDRCSLGVDDVAITIPDRAQVLDVDPGGPTAQVMAACEARSASAVGGFRRDQNLIT